MLHSRAFVLLLATASLLAAPLARAQIGIQPIPDQTVPSGKTLVVPIPATDPGGPARTYTVSTTASTGTSGIMATIRTGDPHFVLGVSYTDSNSMTQTGAMEFQLLREFAPVTSKFIAGLAEGGFYSPKTSGTTTNYITFHRVVPGFVIQGGDPNGNGTGGPGFSFENEFSRALIYSGTAGQLAMANSGNGAGQGLNGTNGSQFFVTLAANRVALDFTYTLFGQLIRGFDTLQGIAGTMLTSNTSSGEYSQPVKPVDITSANVTNNNTDAVLILSGTGLWSGTVTVTASSGTNSATQSFMVTTGSDDVSDPPFLQPPPDITAKNGSGKVALSGTDLQLDFLRYGYQRILPAADPSLTSGSSPLILVPLISNTDNTIAALVDHWNPSQRGYDARAFHVRAGATPINGSLAAIPPGRNSILYLPAPYTVANFTAGAKDTPESFTTSVNWGDGALASSTNDATIAKISSGHFRLIASLGHTYTKAGQYPVVVKIADGAGAHLLLTGTAINSPSSIALAVRDIAQTSGTLKNVIVATFEDNGTGTSAADYAATINWGDGAVTSGAIKSAAADSYQVLGSHAYATPADYTVSTTVSRTGANGYSANACARVAITGTFGPQVFPPFRQAHLAQLWSSVLTDTNSVIVTGTSGGNPYAGLIQGTDGNFYGTTEAGGLSNDGTVYQITASGSLTTLHSFTGGADGANPYSALVEGTNGYFYGTTFDGGANGYGTVYQISTSGSLTTLHAFTDGTDGGNPYSALLAGTDGNLYGVTYNGGAGGYGTVYQVSSSGSVATLHAFTDGTDGAHPFGGLVSGTDGDYYGATTAGGAHGDGAIYQITTDGSFTPLYSFNGASDGASPYGTLVDGTDGNLYGTTQSGGSDGDGTIFQVTTSGSLTSLYSFTGNADGGSPYSGLIQGNDGNFYGTTYQGNSAALYGTVYSITASSTNPTLQTLYTFGNGADGEYPFAPLVQGTDSYLYGATLQGGTNGGFGTVYQLSTSGTFNTIYTFSAGNGTQYAVRASVLIVNSGNVPSTTGAFSVYAAPDGTPDGSATILTQNGQSQFIIPPLKPGQSTLFQFLQQGSTDTRLKAPVGSFPTGDPIIGVVNYNDPVANFDGSQKVIKPGSF